MKIRFFKQIHATLVSRCGLQKFSCLKDGYESGFVCFINMLDKRFELFEIQVGYVRWVGKGGYFWGGVA